MKRSFTAIRSEGGLLPGDLLARVAGGDRKLPAIDEASYGLLAHETVGEAVNRAWSRLVGAWRAFRDAADRLPESDRGTTLTRDRWLLPLFHELGYGRLSPAKAVEADGRSFAVSHAWGQAPIHLVSFRYELDKRLPGVSGAAASSPHGLLQDLLNRSDDHLWGLVSNGLALRVLRDHHSLTRKAYVEFDLAQIFEGELYSEFRILWLVCHSSRVQGDKPAACALEQWFQAARDEGVAALDKLRDGVEQALVQLGTGFMRHPANRRLRDDLASGALSTRDLYRQLLRLAYRLIFLFVAEDRGVLLDPDAPREARERFTRFYTTQRLRELADKKRGGPHGDLWVHLRTLMTLLHEGYPALALPAFGSFLWSPTACAAFAGAELSNEHLLAALRALCTIEDGGLRRSVAWSLVSADELGGVYESLMELHPVVRKESDRDAFVLETAPGHERKTTGSYYTPTSLVDCLLDSALDPVLDEAARKPNPEAALLALKVVDPACGSGHFLVAAARRMAERLARIRTGDAEPAPRDYQHALRDVVGRCIYGVDLNEMAVELCKVALWMEAIEPGKPLSFLDAHIQHGNALLGATPKLVAAGVPDEAWTAITGDDSEVAKALKARNRRERKGQGDLWAAYLAAEAPGHYDVLSGRVRMVEESPDGDLDAVRAKESAWRRLQSSPDVKDATFLADLWCAAFVWFKDREHEAGAPTHELFRRVSSDTASCPADTRQEVRRLAREYRFFHWHLAFPAVFTAARGDRSPDAGWYGGFDVVLGNPPWDHPEIHEEEWFASRAPDVLQSATSAERKAKISALISEHHPSAVAFLQACREMAGLRLMSRGGRFEWCSGGRANTYGLFAELSVQIRSESAGRCGLVLPSGIVLDETYGPFFENLMSRQLLRRVISFYEIRRWFPGTDSRKPFCCWFVAAGSPRCEFIFGVSELGELNEDRRWIELSQSDVRAISGEHFTAPMFLSKADADALLSLYRRGLRLGDSAAGWVDGNKRTRKGLFNTSTDSALFRFDLPDFSSVVPLYEAKMFDSYDHRFGDFEEFRGFERPRELPEVPPDRLQNPTYEPLPYYTVLRNDVETRVPSDWARGWLLVWRDITNATSERTTRVAIVPRVGIADTAGILFPPVQSATDVACLLSNLNSFAFDYAARQRVGGLHLTAGILTSLPVVPVRRYAEIAWLGMPAQDWVSARVLELVYTSWALAPFASDAGYFGSPFRWDRERRHELCAELDAFQFHLYGLSRDDVSYMMSSFELVRRSDVQAFGFYRTRDAILQRFDAMTRAMETGVAYQSALDPPPAHPAIAHDESTRPAWAYRPKGRDEGEVLRLPVRLAPSQPAAVLDLAAVAAGAWARARAQERGEIQAAILAILKAHTAPMARREARLAALLCLEPHLLAPMLDATERAQWVRVVGSDASIGAAASVDGTTAEWGAALTGLRGRGRLVEDLQEDTWALGPGTDAIVTSGWPEGRAGFVVNALRRLQASTQLDAIVLRLPTNVQQWLARAA